MNSKDTNKHNSSNNQEEMKYVAEKTDTTPKKSNKPIKKNLSDSMKN
jgi:hypothetical protein